MKKNEIIIFEKAKGGRIIKNTNCQDIHSTQKWIPINFILDNGIIKTNDCYLKIIKIIPINFSLKSELEKEAILNSYKVFLKTFSHDLQFLIQSKKEDISKHVSSVQKQSQKENKKIQNISNEYIDFIQKMNVKKKSSSKNFYIIIKNNCNLKDLDEYELIACDELHDKFLKIKDCLSRCGNIVINVEDKKAIQDILFSFCNSKKFIF